MGEWEGKRGEEEGRKLLQCSHVVEGQVQLLTKSLALQLLSIHFIWKRTWTGGQHREEWEHIDMKEQKREKNRGFKR